jgi:trehalose 6-phosphate phosphatase
MRQESGADGSAVTGCSVVVSERDIALFLDIDGTVLDIAPTPQSVRVSPELLAALQCAQRRNGGALALISGRTLEDLDRLFAPARFAAAGIHGFERRTADGRLLRHQSDAATLEPARQELRRLAGQNPGILLEDKGSAIAVHYRLAPELEVAVRQSMQRLAGMAAASLILRHGKCVYELVPRACNKGDAISAFMGEVPFAGRTPVFFGDDLTDEDGFAAVNALGGYSIRVGPAAATRARYRMDNVTCVVDWLRQRQNG